MKKRTKPLSGKDTDVIYEMNDTEIQVIWGTTKYTIHNDIIKDILDNYLIDQNEWYPLGASFDNPMKGGLGEYLLEKHELSPRYASLIVPIMQNEGYIDSKGKKPILIMKR